jgi:pimeloyl-ACP methyl ester carboxylesterase
VRNHLPAAWLFALMTIGCTPLVQYRTNYEPCTSADPASQCMDRAIQHYVPAAASVPGDRYWLGFIEFDDQGQLFDRRQMYAVLGQIAVESANDDFILVVFVHGWKHNAREGDDNIDHFRDVLQRLSQTETALSQAQKLPPRKVLGVYLGWRGESVSVPGLDNVTFWDRKNTAHKVGHGAVTEVLNRIDQIRQTKDAQDGSGHSRSRVVVVGHSFGGAVVFSALEQILESRFVQSPGPAGVVGDAAGFGNLVVLVNPAFEALLYSPLSDMSTERASYFESQLPVLAVLTSETDDATKIAFPIGRWFSQFFEKERTQKRSNPISHTEETISERRADMTAVGHFDPYRTHTLSASGKAAAEVRARPAKERAQSVLSVAESWEQDRPGGTIDFPGSVLKRTAASAGRNPYLVIGVDRALIPNHDDIWDPRVESFIAHLILVSSQSSDLSERRAQRKVGQK